MPNPKVLIAAPVHQLLIDSLSELGYHCVVHQHITQSAAFSLIEDCAGVVTSTRLQLDKALIDAAPRLRWIGRMGSGMEVIDLDHARSKGIACFGSPEGNCNAVGEHALGMLLSLTRHIAWSQQELRQGVWKRDENRGIELEGKTLGIIGFGHTGAAFAKKLSGFDMRILVYDKYAPEKVSSGYEGCRTLDKIMAEADILSFHVPLQKDTIHYFNEAFISGMRKPFIFINTSRGQVADMSALYNGLKQGKILGACLDVFEQEPLSAMDDHQSAIFGHLIQMPNVVATPHIAGYTFEALYKMSKTLAERIEGVIKA
jgi:D-3-phosphoglycerate dehydrogenase